MTRNLNDFVLNKSRTEELSHYPQQGFSNKRAIWPISTGRLQILSKSNPILHLDKKINESQYGFIDQCSYLQSVTLGCQFSLSLILDSVSAQLEEFIAFQLQKVFLETRRQLAMPHHSSHLPQKPPNCCLLYLPKLSHLLLHQEKFCTAAVELAVSPHANESSQDLFTCQQKAHTGHYNRTKNCHAVRAPHSSLWLI